MITSPFINELAYLGDWSEVQVCPTLMAVCGVRTQVDEVSTGNCTEEILLIK